MQINGNRIGDIEKNGWSLIDIGCIGYWTGETLINNDCMATTSYRFTVWCCYGISHAKRSICLADTSLHACKETPQLLSRDRYSFPAKWELMMIMDNWNSLWTGINQIIQCNLANLSYLACKNYLNASLYVQKITYTLRKKMFWNIQLIKIWLASNLAYKKIYKYN